MKDWKKYESLHDTLQSTTIGNSEEQWNLKF